MNRAGEPPSVEHKPRARAVRWLSRAWRGMEKATRTTGRAARGNHGSRAMLVVWLIAAMFGCVVLVYALTLRTPSWFTIGTRDPAEARRLAQRLENRIITEAYRFRGEPSVGPDGVRRTGEDWRLRVTEEEATAWLAVKLSEWLVNRDPPSRVPAGVSELQAHFGNGRAWGAGRMEESVYAISGLVRVDKEGVWLTSPRAGVGSFWLPISWGGLGLLGSGGLEGRNDVAWKMVSGKVPLVSGGTVRLEDGRRVRVLGVKIEPGVVVVECRTEVP